MKTTGKNRSSEKTKKAIKLAFAQLLKEKGELRKMSVSEIVSRADINRGTFYIHYDSIYGVAEDFEEEILESLALKNHNIISINNFDSYFHNILNYLRENEDIYKMLLVSDDPRIFLNRLNRDITKTLFNSLSNDSKIKKSKSLKFDISFFVDGIINQILRYFTDKDFTYSLDDIEKYMDKYFNVLFIHTS